MNTTEKRRFLARYGSEDHIEKLINELFNEIDYMRDGSVRLNICINPITTKKHLKKLTKDWFIKYVAKRQLKKRFNVIV